jgi:hypothetical protein
LAAVAAPGGRLEPDEDDLLAETFALLGNDDDVATFALLPLLLLLLLVALGTGAS